MAKKAKKQTAPNKPKGANTANTAKGSENLDDGLDDNVDDGLDDNVDDGLDDNVDDGLDDNDDDDNDDDEKVLEKTVDPRPHRCKGSYVSCTTSEMHLTGKFKGYSKAYVKSKGLK